LLSAIGYIIHEFGAGSLLVRAVPVFFGVPQSKEFLSEVISGLILHGDKDGQELKQDDIIRMACKKAVKANQRLSPSEMDNLIQELMKADMPFTCPHGRPAFVTLTRYQLEKMFKRIV
jgi:DNA mismatch repair protein MutL